MQAFKLFVRVNMDLTNVRSAAPTSVARPMFTEEYMATHDWPSDNSKTMNGYHFLFVPDCLVQVRNKVDLLLLFFVDMPHWFSLKQVHMQAVMNILRKENKVQFLYGRNKFYEIIRKRFLTVRARWTKKVCMSYTSSTSAQWMNFYEKLQITTGTGVIVGCGHDRHKTDELEVPPKPNSLNQHGGEATAKHKYSSSEATGPGGGRAPLFPYEKKSTDGKELVRQLLMPWGSRTNSFFITGLQGGRRRLDRHQQSPALGSQRHELSAAEEETAFRDVGPEHGEMIGFCGPSEPWKPLDQRNLLCHRRRGKDNQFCVP